MEGAKCRDLRSKPESKAKPEIERRRGLGRGLGEPISRKFLKILIETVQSGVWFKQKSIFSQWQIMECAEDGRGPHFDPSQIPRARNGTV